MNRCAHAGWLLLCAVDGPLLASGSLRRKCLPDFTCGHLGEAEPAFLPQGPLASPRPVLRAGDREAAP